MTTTASGSTGTGPRCASTRWPGRLSQLLPVLDAIGQAREHWSQLSGGFKSVAHSLQAAVG